MMQPGALRPAYWLSVDTSPFDFDLLETLPALGVFERPHSLGLEVRLREVDLYVLDGRIHLGAWLLRLDELYS